ncbi:MAG TPA: hypothetical protein VF782_15405 [Allosphingosinicella sp.]|jgi:anion-transporting  ArsA/GET3 family ATPase
MSGQNQDLLALSRSLNATAEALQARKRASEDAAERTQINAQLRAINQRIQAVNGLLFVQRSEAISVAVARVEEAQEDLGRAIAEAERINQVINSVTGVLQLVDRAIAVATPLV